jgi:hypothetical protein
LIVMRAALQCSPAAAAEVLSFIKQNRLVDARLAPFQKALEKQGVTS